MSKYFLSEEEINIAFLGKEVVNEIAINQKKKIIKRKISLGILILFLTIGRII